MSARSPRRWSTLANRPAGLVFALALVVGLALRIVVTFGPAYQLNSDQSVVFLMARHVTRGELPAFYWGQAYGGTLLQLSAGVVMAAVGQSVTVFAIITALWWSAAAVLLRRMTIGVLGPAPATLAGVLFWFPGSTLLLQTVGDPGFYGPSLVLGLGSVHLAIGWTNAASWRRWIALGAIAGLALWTSPTALAFVAPAGVRAAIVDRRWARWLVGVLAAAVAGLPWLLETVSSRLGSVKPLGGSSIHMESFVTVFTEMIPAAFPFGTTRLGGLLIGFLAGGALVAVLVAGIVWRNTTATLLAVATLMVLLVLVVGSGVRLAGDSVRYTTYFLPLLTFAVAWLVSRIRPLQLLAGMAAPALTVTMIASVGGFAVSSRHDPFDQGFDPVKRVLASRDITRAYGSYWLAYGLTASTAERITVADLGVGRNPEYEKGAARRSPQAIVVFRDQGNDRLLQSTAGLPPHSRAVVGNFSVWIFDRWFDPSTIAFGTV